MTRAVASVVGAIVLAAFVAAGAGLFLQAAWWRPLAVASAVASLVLIAAMWDGLPSSPAIAAAVFDASILVALVVIHWPTEEMIGA